jgi:hypothetical protein|tara:strand:- start:317 stop:505 length:189 start_codon:yes stop_codon:yes gene_type:complete
MAKSKATKKELQDIVARLIANVAMLEQKIASYNTLFGMYVGFKGDDKDFQAYLKTELEKKDD